MKKNTISEKVWNFSSLPNAEVESCYYYEYSLECERVKAEVETSQKKASAFPTEWAKVEKWIKKQPAPSNDDEWQELYQQAAKIHPSANRSSALRYDLHFLCDCAHFPQKHWLEIDIKERSELATWLAPERYKWGSDPVHMETRKLLITPFETFKKSSFTDFFKKHSNYSDDFAFSLCWLRADSKLLEDFKEWLEENRPKGQLPFHKTKGTTSRQTGYKDFLKALGAFRLLRNFNDNWKQAAAHTATILGGDKELYRDQAAWLKAKKRASEEIQKFPNKVIGSGWI